MYTKLTPEEALEIENRLLREMAERFGALQESVRKKAEAEKRRVAREGRKKAKGEDAA